MQTAPLIQSLATLSPKARASFVASLSEAEIGALEHLWRAWARPAQLAPEWDWDTWLVKSGRGFGKTRLGAEWVHEEVDKRGAVYVALIAETKADARDVMAEGPAGIIKTMKPWNKCEYEPSKRRITWANGAIGTLFSGDEPGQLRGPQFHFAWIDELAKMRYAAEVLSNLDFGLRLGEDIRVLITSTPRPTAEIKALLKEARSPSNPRGTLALTNGHTFDNAANLAKKYLAKLKRKYVGTRLGQQELEGNVLGDNPGALWKRDWIDRSRHARHCPDESLAELLSRLVRIVVAVDISVSSNKAEDEDPDPDDWSQPATGIVVVGIDEDWHCYVLADESMVKPTPDEWGKRVAATWKHWDAECVVAEINQGGDLVASNIKLQNPLIHVAEVRASKGKRTRAEPVAALSEQKRLHHVGAFSHLEGQLCEWDPAINPDSPDRLDALVWGITYLAIEQGDPGPSAPPAEFDAHTRFGESRGGL